MAKLAIDLKMKRLTNFNINLTLYCKMILLHDNCYICHATVLIYHKLCCNKLRHLFLGTEGPSICVFELVIHVGPLESCNISQRSLSQNMPYCFTMMYTEKM